MPTGMSILGSVICISPFFANGVPGVQVDERHRVRSARTKSRAQQRHARAVGAEHRLRGFAARTRAHAAAARQHVLLYASVVFALVAALSLATRAADTRIPAFQHYGGYVSAGVSGMFLWIIGILNLVVLLDVIRIFREMRGGEYDRERLEIRLLSGDDEPVFGGSSA